LVNKKFLNYFLNNNIGEPFKMIGKTRIKTTPTNKTIENEKKKLKKNSKPLLLYGQSYSIHIINNDINCRIKVSILY